MRVSQWHSWCDQHRGISMTSEQGGQPSERWERIKEVFGAALEREPAARVAYLDEVCAGDAEVRREVEALLAAHWASDSFLEHAAVDISPSPAPVHSAFADGQTIGTYRILSTLGQGGMATVYLARDLRHRRSVALKVLHPDLAHALGADRFLREIEVAANLSHPHILPLHDSGEAAGLLYYVMPYVEGESLRDRLRRETQLSVPEALLIAREVADALAYAHGQGIIHRDIKPENILLSGGHALVADFGIARVLGQADSARLTESGMAIGTAAYMSPEQASAASHIDGRSDIYSLGCVVYEMLAGEPPYTGPTAQAIIAKRFSDPVPRIRRVRPGVPEHVDQAVTLALAPVPADRFATAAEFAHTLQPSPIGPRTGPTVQLAAAVSDSGRRRRVPLAATALGLGILTGLGVLFVWRRNHAGAGEAAGAKVLAVLPFENLGDSSQAYFADGVGDDVRGKLSQLQGLAVIARASSNEYRHTSKSPQQIARELGAEYLLTATVRWDKHQDGTSRVRVSPELVRVEPGAAPRTKWQQGFDAALTDVFQVQADISGQVAQALNLALGDSAKHELAAKPTLSLPAYDAFLRGQAAFRRDPPNFRQAATAYEQAVALDSTFVEAWAQLAEAQGKLYLSTPTPAGAEAVRRTAERALAVAPTRAEGHEALAAYYGLVVGDNVRGLTEDSIAFALSPGNAQLLGYVGQDEFVLGRWEEARRHLEEAIRLDPHSPAPARGLRIVLLYTHQYLQAEQALNQALELEPANLEVRYQLVQVALGQGDLARAQAVLRGIPREADPTALVTAAADNDLVWVLDPAQQQLLLRLRPSAFDDDRATWGLVLAQTHALQGDTAKARVYADSARLVVESQLVDAPDNAVRHALLGLALAYAGRRREAMREGQRATVLMPTAKDAYLGPFLQHQLVRICLLVGEPEKALDQLEPLLKIPYYLSPAWLKIDPNFVPLRGNPRFERLVNGS
jgi:TolB-like protein/Tfp pilus assembly protein PilF